MDAPRVKYPLGRHAVAKAPLLRLENVKRTDGIKGFVVLPRRWAVERTFSWFGRNRRLVKDYESLAERALNRAFALDREHKRLV